MAFRTKRWSKANKYGSIRTRIGKEVFDSKREARDHVALKLREKADEIQGLRRQVRIPLVVEGMKVADYIADHVYFERGAFGVEKPAAYELIRSIYGAAFSNPGEWRFIIADTKGWRTHVYILKRKLVRAIYGIDIRET